MPVWNERNIVEGTPIAPGEPLHGIGTNSALEVQREGTVYNPIRLDLALRDASRPVELAVCLDPMTRRWVSWNFVGGRHAD